MRKLLFARLMDGCRIGCDNDVCLNFLQFVCLFNVDAQVADVFFLRGCSLLINATSLIDFENENVEERSLRWTERNRCCCFLWFSVFKSNVFYYFLFTCPNALSSSSTSCLFVLHCILSCLSGGLCVRHLFVESWQYGRFLLSPPLSVELL